MGKFADFDAQFEAQDPLVVKLYGDEWELPSAMPAIVMLKVAKWAATGRQGDTLTSAELLDLAADLIPAPILDEWTGRGLSGSRLAQILTWVMGCYMGSARPESPPEAEAPVEGAASTSSSSTGG